MRLLMRLTRRRIFVVGLVLLALAVISAVFAPWVAPFSPQKMQVANRLAAPSAIHPFGTDEFGRDVLSRTIYGARLSLLVGFLVVVVSGVIGTAMGLVAGYVRSLDAALMRLTDAMMAFPDILLAIALMAGLGPGLLNVVLALGIVYTPRIARIVRAATLILRELQFIEAAEAIGATRSRIIMAHLLPNLVSPIIVQATFVFAYAILTEAALSFLGVGVPPTVATWGNMIASAQQVMQQAEWLILAPGIAIALTVVSLQIFGDGLRDALDPRLRRVV
ncbi:MAG: ABC transporter permease [Proteobacteria bacterium]|nr:ABC transporter permease [Pseudomonadota bacterium]MBI3496974.1 ABC transporter permease [Pseudomonadota bacterium]